MQFAGGSYQSEPHCSSASPGGVCPDVTAIILVQIALIQMGPESQLPAVMAGCCNGQHWLSLCKVGICELRVGYTPAGAGSSAEHVASDLEMDGGDSLCHQLLVTDFSAQFSRAGVWATVHWTVKSTGSDMPCA